MKRLHKSKLYLLLVAALTIPIFSSAQEMESHIGNLTGRSEAGRELYYRYCWGCHGARGDGNGENAPYVNPNPRNFVQGTFKCRSTPTGTFHWTRICTIPCIGDSISRTCQAGKR